MQVARGYGHQAPHRKELGLQGRLHLAVQDGAWRVWQECVTARLDPSRLAGGWSRPECVAYGRGAGSPGSVGPMTKASFAAANFTRQYLRTRSSPIYVGAFSRTPASLLSPSIGLPT
jgi:hypothetical protein